LSAWCRYYHYDYSLATFVGILAESINTMAGIHMSNELFERAVLSAPSAKIEVHILSKVILIVSILSIIGAGWIILSYCVSKPVSPPSHES
jgi:hypothetical protein